MVVGLVFAFAGGHIADGGRALLVLLIAGLVAAIANRGRRRDSIAANVVACDGKVAQPKSQLRLRPQAVRVRPQRRTII